MISKGHWAISTRRRLWPMRVCVLLLLEVSMMSVSVASAETTGLPEAAKEAVLKGEWSEAAAILDRADIKEPDAVCRAVAGHAMISLNRTTPAWLLFLSLRQPDAVEACLEWTEALVKEHKQNAMAHYFRGDALARGGRLQEVEKEFSQALRLDKKLALAWSARGVVRTLRGDEEAGLLDLVRATELRPDMADLHANVGVYWTGQRAAEGALKRFELALQHDPMFALAYNGRGCALFGMGKYEEAVEDFEKAFELCPVLSVAGANQGIVLAALDDEENPGTKGQRPAVGTTLASQTKLGKIDLVDPSAQRFAQFEQGVRSAANQGDFRTAFQAIAEQKARWTVERNQVVAEIGRLSSGVKAAGGLEQMFRNFDRLVSIVPTEGHVARVVSEPRNVWKLAMSLGNTAAEMSADLSLDNPARYDQLVWSEFGVRLSTPETLSGVAGATKGILRAASFLGAESARIPQDVGQAHIGMLSAKLQWLNTVDGKLTRLQQDTMAKGINQNLDFKSLDCLGLGQLAAPGGTPRPLREYRISSAAPVVHYSVVAGATGKDIAPAGHKPYVLIAGGERTDPLRLGTVVRRYEELGATTIPIPSGMAAARYMRSLGLSSDQTVVLNITRDDWQRQHNVMAPNWRHVAGPTPGGVMMEIRPRTDRGVWPVLTGFTLNYPLQDACEGR